MTGGIAHDDPGGQPPQCLHAGSDIPFRVGIRDLENNLSKYIGRVRSGEEVVVTDRGKPVARLSGIDSPTDRIAELVAAGLVRAPTRSTRHRSRRRIEAKGPVSDLVAEQRR